MAARLKNITTADGYTVGATVQQAETDRILMQVANAGVYYELDTSPRGDGQWDQESFLLPCMGTLPRKCGGVRFRSAATGVPAQVSADLLNLEDLGDAQGGGLSPFLATVTAGGVVTPPVTAPSQLAPEGAQPGDALVWNGTTWTHSSVNLATALPGHALSYTEVGDPVNITATTEATANTIATSAAVTCDGSSFIWIEFWCPYIQRGTTWIRLYLYDGANSIGSVGYTEVGVVGAGVTGKRRLIPSAGSHTYSIRGVVDAGTGVVGAGPGGTSLYMPAYLSITKA